MDVDARIERLERDNRRLKIIGVLALCLVSSVFLMGQARPADVIEAQKFVLVDSDGKKLGELGIGSGGLGHLWLEDGTNVGKGGVALQPVQSQAGGGGLLVMGTSETGGSRFEIRVYNDDRGPSITARDAQYQTVWTVP